DASAELVEIADQIVMESSACAAPVVVLHEMASRTGNAGALADSETLSGAAKIFDSIAYLPDGRLGKQLGRALEVVALPGRSLERELRHGDVLIRRSDGEMAHVAVIAEPKLRSLEALLAEGITPEAFNAGNYAQVVEGGARPHTSSDHFARQLTDS